MRPDFHSRCRSRSCQAEIAWVETEAGKKMPIDRASPAGNIWLEQDGERALIAHVVGPNAARPPAGAPLYTSHFATCPAAAQHRRPRQQDDRAWEPVSRTHRGWTTPKPDTAYEQDLKRSK